MRIVIIAAEASGDILGAGLIRALRQHYPDAHFEGIGGPLMCAQGFHTLVPLETLSVMGLVEVLGRLRSLLALRNRLMRRYRAQPPAVVIGIDAPDFNLGLERELKRTGIPTVHYVSPSVWAWKRKRIYTIKAAADLLLTLFPFEAAYYRPTNQRLTYVGHPLADTIARERTELAMARQHLLGATQTGPVIALLPGSRAAEIRYLAPPFLAAARLLQQRYPGAVFLLPAANEQRYQELTALISRDFAQLNLQLLKGQSRQVMAAADVILIASGTATLEATLLHKPMVVAYKMAWLTYAVYSRMLTTAHVALPNILAGESLVPEILQDQVTAQRLAAAVSQWLDHPEQSAHLQQRLATLSRQLQQDADSKAAAAIIDLLESARA